MVRKPIPRRWVTTCLGFGTPSLLSTIEKSQLSSCLSFSSLLPQSCPEYLTQRLSEVLEGGAFTQRQDDLDR